MASRTVVLLAGFRLLFPFLDASGRALLDLRLDSHELAQVPADLWTRQVIRRLLLVAVIVVETSGHALLRGIIQDADATIAAEITMEVLSEILCKVCRGSRDQERQQQGRTREENEGFHFAQQFLSVSLSVSFSEANTVACDHVALLSGEERMRWHSRHRKLVRRAVAFSPLLVTRAKEAAKAGVTGKRGDAACSSKNSWSCLSLVQRLGRKTKLTAAHSLQGTALQQSNRGCRSRGKQVDRTREERSDRGSERRRALVLWSAPVVLLLFACDSTLDQLPPLGTWQPAIASPVASVAPASIAVSRLVTLSSSLSSSFTSR